MSTRVAVVTGSNKGIGYAIVKSLCKEFEGDVYLTARDERRGLAAIRQLNELGYYPKFHLLDVTVPESVGKLRDHIVQHYGGLDILVNNAGMAFDKDNTWVPLGVQARETTRVNYFALRDTCNILFPILKPHARVVNLTSLFGHLSFIPDKKLRDILASPNLVEEELSNLMNSFVKAAESGTLDQEGWPTSAYAVSKVGVSALSRIQQRELQKDENRSDIVVNHVHPGYVDTDMTSHKGHLTIEEGAQAPVFLALLPENCAKPKGDYVWCTKDIVDWVKGPLPDWMK